MNDSPLSPAARSLRAGLLLLGFVGLAILAWLPSLSDEPGFCPLRTNWGLPCALCGGTRALQALEQGDSARAWSLNPLVFPLTAAALLVGSLLGSEVISGKRLIHFKTLRFRHVGWGVAALTLFWIAQVYEAVTTPKPELLGHPFWIGFTKEK
jgi:hypothetical protein